MTTETAIEPLYRTHPGPQDAMMLSQAEELLYGGAMGGGKSKALRAYGVDYCLRYPGATVSLFRQSYGQLEDTHIRWIEREVPESVAEYKVGAHNLVFPNGSILMFRYCETDDDVRKYFTSEFDALLIDELTEFTEHQYVNLLSRVRSSRPWWPGPRVRCGCMPGGIGHDWVRRHWIDFAKPYEIKRAPDEDGGLTRQFIPAKAGDNPSLNPDYLKQLKMLPEEEYRAKALGDWDIFTGQYFTRWRDHVHVCDSFTPPPDWARYMAVDYGFGKPYCCLWAARPPKTDSLWFYREHYATGVPAREQVQRAREASVNERIQLCVLDPSMYSRTNVKGEIGSPISDDWTEGLRGIAEVVRGNNERIPGWSVVRDMLEWTEGPGGVTLVPSRMHAMRSCPNLIRTLPRLQHDKNNVEDVDTEGDDHAPDAARYLVRYLFGAREVPRPVQYVMGPRGLVALPARQKVGSGASRLSSLP